MPVDEAQYNGKGCKTDPGFATLLTPLCFEWYDMKTYGGAENRKGIKDQALMPYG